MTDALKHERTAQCIAEAVAWHTYLHESELATTPDFEGWLKDPSNAHVWGQMVSVWDFLGEQAREPELVSARTKALMAVKRAMAQRRESSRRWPRATPASIGLRLPITWWAAWWCMANGGRGKWKKFPTRCARWVSTRSCPKLRPGAWIGAPLSD